MQVSKAGVALLLAFVVSQAIRDVHLGHLFGSLGLFEAAFLAFGTAALAFSAALLLFRKQQIGLLRREWRGVLALNITTTLAWMSYFGSLRLAEPAACNLAFSGVTPIAVAGLSLAGLRTKGEEVATGFERTLHWALLGMVILVALIVSEGGSGFARTDSFTGLAGVALAAFAGLAITAESIYAKRMNQRGVSPLAIVGVRFLMVTVFAGLMVTRIDAPYADMSAPAVVQQALIFLAILIGPIYLAQRGLALTTPLISGVILSVGPVATLALQSSAGGLALTSAMLAVTLLYALISIVAALCSTVNRIP